MTKRKLKHAENDIFLEDRDLDEREDVEVRHGRKDRAYHGGEGSGEHSHKKGRRKRRRWPFVLLLIAAAVAAVLLYNNFRTGRNWTVAVFGVDSREGQLESGTRSDVIMLVNIDRKTGEVKLCSVFRDTYLKISEDGEYGKINKAYERGGHEQAVAALEENLDIKIDDYATFSWGTVATLINAVGGVDLEITDSEFRYINSFITETVEATGIPSVHLSSAGWNHLDGVQAVAYGRLRLMDTDFQRTARQRKVLSLALEKAKQADALTLIAVVQSLMSEVSTSVDLGDIIPIINTLYKFNIPEDASSGFPFSRQTEDIGSQNYVIPTTLESNVVTLHNFLFGDEDYEASQSVRDISARIASDSGLGTAGEDAPVPQVGGSSGGSSGTAAEPAPSQEPETAAEPETETESETETLPETETGTDTGTGSEEGAENESEDGPSAGNETGEDTETDGDSDQEEEQPGPGSSHGEDRPEGGSPGTSEGRPVERPTAPSGEGPMTGDKEGPSDDHPDQPAAKPEAPTEQGPQNEKESLNESLSQLDKDVPVVESAEAGPGSGI